MHSTVTARRRIVPDRPRGLHLTGARIRLLGYAAAVVSGSLAATIWYAIARGQDFNWDQQNYHIGIPFLLAHGTFWSSIAPAGIQSYLNPYVLQAQFLALRHLSPIDFAVALAAVQSLAFVMAGVICAGIVRPSAGWKTLPIGLLGFALCLTAPMSLSEAGTTFIDLTTAVPVLAAYAILLTRGRRLGLVISGALAGALLGCAAALKLTNGLFALGVVGFALAGPEPLRMRLKWLLASGCASIVAFAATGGRWYLTVWERFGNPFFPFYNNIFRSPDFSQAAFHDTRFLPHSILAVWRYPLYWWLGGSPRPGVGSPSSEIPFIDIRWIVAIAGCTAFLVALPFFRDWRRSCLAKPATGLLFAFVIDYLAWLGEFGIHRYMLPLDIVCGAVILVLATQMRPYPLRLGMLLLLAGATWYTMRVPDWGHLPWRPYWQATIDPRPLDFRGPSFIFLTSKPTTFLAVSLPADARYADISGDFDLRKSSNTSLTRQLAQELTSMRGTQLKEVDEGAVPAVSAAILASYGLVETGPCTSLSVVGKLFRICDVERRP